MPVYLFIAKDSKGNEVFKRALYARNKKNMIAYVLHDENKKRSYYDQFLRYKLSFSITELVKSVPELD